MRPVQGGCSPFGLMGAPSSARVSQRVRAEPRNVARVGLAVCPVQPSGALGPLRGTELLAGPGAGPVQAVLTAVALPADPRSPLVHLREIPRLSLAPAAQTRLEERAKDNSVNPGNFCP